MEKKVILITGASSGIGYETAKELAQQGNKVYGAARQVEKMVSLKEYGVTPLHLDVTDESSCREQLKRSSTRKAELTSWSTMQVMAAMAPSKTWI